LADGYTFPPANSHPSGSHAQSSAQRLYKATDLPIIHKNTPYVHRQLSIGVLILLIIQGSVLLYLLATTTKVHLTHWQSLIMSQSQKMFGYFQFLIANSSKYHTHRQFAAVFFSDVNEPV